MHEEYCNLLEYAISFWSPEKRIRIAEKLGCKPADRLPGGILIALHAKYGMTIALIGGVFLFGWCFLVSILLDTVLAQRQAAHALLGLMSCIAAFSLCGERSPRSLLKLMFLVCTALGNGLWTLAAGFVVIYECITSSPKRGGD